MIFNPIVVKSGEVDTSDATATAADILSPKTAYVNGEKITGSIAARTYADIINADTVGQLILPSGYYASQATIVRTDSLQLSTSNAAFVSNVKVSSGTVSSAIQLTLSGTPRNGLLSSILSWAIEIPGYNGSTVYYEVYYGPTDVTNKYGMGMYSSGSSLAFAANLGYAVSGNKLTIQCQSTSFNTNFLSMLGRAVVTYLL